MRAKAAWHVASRWTRRVTPAGWLATARQPGHIEQLEKPSSSRGEIRGSWVGRRTGDPGKSADDERVTDGSVVAPKRGNARGAKGPCCSRLLRQHGRQGCPDKSTHHLQDLKRGLYARGKAGPGGPGGVGGGSVVTAHSAAAAVGRISLGVKRAGERSAGNPPAPFDVAGVGNVARGAGLRPPAKAVDSPPDPTVRAPVLDPTGGGRLEKGFVRGTSLAAYPTARPVR